MAHVASSFDELVPYCKLTLRKLNFQLPLSWADGTEYEPLTFKVAAATPDNESVSGNFSFTMALSPGARLRPEEARRGATLGRASSRS